MTEEITGDTDHPDEEDQEPLRYGMLGITLSAAVPLYVVECHERGGPTAEDIARIRPFAHTLAERGDRLLFRSEKAGETAALFNMLAEAIALLAYAPGGVQCFGQHFEAYAILTSMKGEAAAFGALVRQVGRKNAHHYWLATRGRLPATEARESGDLPEAADSASPPDPLPTDRPFHEQ